MIDLKPKLTVLDGWHPVDWNHQYCRKEVDWAILAYDALFSFPWITFQVKSLVFINWKPGRAIPQALNVENQQALLEPRKQYTIVMDEGSAGLRRRLVLCIHSLAFIESSIVPCTIPGHHQVFECFVLDCYELATYVPGNRKGAHR